MKMNHFKHPDLLKLLNSKIQNWILEKWSEFTYIQEYSITKILKEKEKCDLVLSAPTAGGKTMAVFLPLLSELYNVNKSGFQILYICPTRALINQQFDEEHDLRQISKLLDIEVSAWSGDIYAEHKTKSWNNPSGVLIITPESLEGRFIKRPYELLSRFSNLRAIVIDELHVYFESPRGKQLISLLTRLEDMLKKSSRNTIQRIALSATVGNNTDDDLNSIHNFLRPKVSILNKGLNVNIDKYNNNFDITVNIFLDDPKNDDKQETREKISNHIQKTFDHEEKGIIFTNSRRETERYSNLLNNDNNKLEHSLLLDKLPNSIEDKKLNEEKFEEGGSDPKSNHKNLEKVNKMDRPIIFDDLQKDCRRYWPHHGSLGKSRLHAEKRMRIVELPCILVATTTLELGIDVGEINRVAQIGPGYSVASLRQRLGRSGRSPDGKKSNSKMDIYLREPDINDDDNIIYKLRLSVFQTIAQIILLKKGVYETPNLDNIDLSTFVQQLVSTIYQYRESGISKKKLKKILIEKGPFYKFDEPLFPYMDSMKISIFDAVIQRLLSKHKPLIDIEKYDGYEEFFLTDEGDKLVNSTIFFAAFKTPIEYTIKSSSKKLGTIGYGQNYGTGDNIIFAGKTWQIVGIDHKKHTIEVKASGVGKPSYFTGDSLSPSEVVVTKMRELYELDEKSFIDLLNKHIKFRTKNDKNMVIKAQNLFHKIDLQNEVYIPIKLNSGNEFKDLLWFPWVGKENLLGITKMLKEYNIPSNIFRMAILIQDRNKKEIIEALEKYLNNKKKIEEISRTGFVSYSGKFDHFLSPSLWRREKACYLGSDEIIQHSIKHLVKSLKKGK